MELWFERLLILSVLMVVAVTFGYPMLLAIVGPLLGRRHRSEDAEPTVTLIIAAHNEESCIARRIENALALDYPRQCLDIVVASDGSTDRTAEIVRTFEARGVALLDFPRMGKTGIQNKAVREARGTILVFSDANAFYRPDAIRKLVRNFADSDVACVSGQLVYQTAGTGAGAGEDSYWTYEKFMKRRESDLSSLIGVNGSIYAVRRTDYVEIDPGLISDFVEPLALVRAGKRVVYEPEAVSLEEASTTYTVEFRRKVRILTRSIKGLLHMRVLLNPFRYGLFSFQLVMHKLCRYLVPLFLATGGLSLVGLAVVGRYQAPLAACAITGAAVLAVGRGIQGRSRNPVVRVCQLLYYYLMVNYALVKAWVNVLKGTGVTVWVPDRRQA